MRCSSRSIGSSRPSATSLATGFPTLPGAVRTRPAGGEQVVVDVFPVEPSDKVLLSGVRAELWMQPGVTRETLREHTASGLRDVTRHGYVTLVLGAGNIASIPPLDVLTVLYTHGSVVVAQAQPGQRVPARRSSRASSRR